MSKQKVIVLAVRSQGLGVTAATGRCGVSRRWVHELLRREGEGGMDAPSSRGPNARRATRSDHRSRYQPNPVSAYRIGRCRTGRQDPSPSPGTSNAKDWARPRPPRSAGSFTPQASSPPNRRNDPKPPWTASKQTGPRRPGNRTSPHWPSSTRPTPRSRTSLATATLTYSPAPRSDPSPPSWPPPRTEASRLPL